MALTFLPAAVLTFLPTSETKLLAGVGVYTIFEEIVDAVRHTLFYQSCGIVCATDHCAGQTFPSLFLPSELTLQVVNMLSDTELVTHLINQIQTSVFCS